MNKWLSLGFIAMIQANSVAAMDVYGTSEANAKKIKTSYEKDITSIERALQRSITSGQEIPSKQKQAMKKKREQLVEQIKKEYGFVYVNFNSVHYPDTHKIYTTLEVISPLESYRMHFVDPLEKQEYLAKKNPYTPTVIDKMMEYDELGASIVLNPNYPFKAVKCPVFHCTWGFEDPQLKPYLQVFNDGVLKDRKLILETLKGSDTERRAAAIFLVGHFHDPREIITLVSPYIKDKRILVRNNAMRVIGATILKAKMKDINIEPFLAALDSPYDTDRNKSLIILWSVADEKNIKHRIIQQGGDSLIKLLRLQQPNNHDIAYLLLKKISGQNFGPTAVTAWQKWLVTQRHQLAG